jgi:hypothetical protein
MKKSKKAVARKAVKSAKPALKTQIAIILDRSGSMVTCAKETVDAFNEQVKTIRQGQKKGMDTRVSLFTFSTTADEPQFFNEPVTALKELRQDEYSPGGFTAMYDGVGKAIAKLEGLGEGKDTSYLLVIISDGQENNSHVFTSAMVAEKIKALQGTNHWTVTYLGANQDLSQISKALHIPAGNMMAFVNTGVGVHAASMNLSAATSSYVGARAMGATAVNNFYSDVGTGKKSSKVGARTA